MRSTPALLLLLGAVGGIACGRPAHAALSASDRKLIATRKERVEHALTTPGDMKTAIAKWIMPVQLREISGLALTRDGRILTHNDERGMIYVIDPRSGILLSQFSLVPGPVRGDFESITMVGSKIYMMTSKGEIYEIAGEAPNGGGATYVVHDTGLGKECEFESLAYDADSNWLVLPCKTVRAKSQHDQLVMYRWRLSGPDSSRVSMTSLPLSEIVGDNPWKRLHVSDMTIDPFTKHYVLIASHEKALIELTPDGELVRAMPMPGDHEQPEGVAISPDGILMISDEAVRSPATITLYRWTPAAPTTPTK